MPDRPRIKRQPPELPALTRRFDRAFLPWLWPVRSARSFPTWLRPSTDTLKGRYVEFPQEFEDSSLITAVDANVERSDILIALAPWSRP